MSLLAYFKERMRPAVFGPVVLLLATAACWVSDALRLLPFAYTVGLTALVVTEFRLWDDLADRTRDRSTHPDRVLVRADPRPLQVLAVALAVAGLAAAWGYGGSDAFLALAVLDVTFAVLYGLVRPHLNEKAWQYPVLLSKYPAFVGVGALFVGAPDLQRAIMATLLVYVAANLREAIFAGRPAGSRADSRAPSPEMFESVRCLCCSSQRSTFHIEAEDDLTGRRGRFTFVRCSDCGLVYQTPRLSLEHIKSYYDNDYIAHQERKRWGPLAPLVEWAMGSIDRAKLRIVSRYVTLGAKSAVLDVGSGAGTFLAKLRETAGAIVVGVDFVDLSARPVMRGVEFHHGLFYDQSVGAGRFDLITMWHFLEHDYDPMRSLHHAAEALAPDGRIVLEVPRLDSMSARLFGDRWPGLQAPQHTVLFEKATLSDMVRRAGLEIVDYLPYGAFPPYFYLFCGTAFWWRKGRGLDLNRAVVPYFAGQVALFPILPILQRSNFAMQTIVCRKPRQ